MPKSVPQKDPSKINRRKLKKCLTKYEECTYCNLVEKFRTDTRCLDCPYYPSSSKGQDVSNKGVRPCVAIYAEVFKPMGITTYNSKNNTALGKSHLYMYYYYPSLNWQPPPIPDFDRFGKPVNKETAVFELAHLDGDEHNDRKKNLFWFLRNEHKTLEPNTKKGSKR